MTEYADAPIGRVPGSLTDIGDPVPEPAPEPEANERPEWLPENFKSPEDLARSYREAQNKIRQQGTELNALREAVATLELEQQAVSLPDPLAAMAHLTAQTQAPQYAPQAPMTPELVVAAGANMAASQLQDYDQYAGRLSQLFESDQNWTQALAQAAATGNPATVSGILASAVQTLQTAGELRSLDTRAMKLGAQGISGGQSGRPDNDPQSAEQAWARIRDAGQGDYASYMRGR